MMCKLLRCWLVALVTASCSFGVHAAAAEQYPVRSIRLVVPYPAGGGTDITSRLIAPRLAESMGQQVVVDNRPGADSIIGTEIVAKAAPDGYTIMMATMAFGANPALYSKLPYDSQKDFVPATLVAIVPMVLTVHPSVPARSVRALIALAKARPGSLNVASGGPGSANQLAAELFKSMTATNMVNVQYKGGALQVVALLSGEVSMGFSTISSALPHYRSGKLIPLSITTSKRNSVLPEVPTVAESGVPGYEFFEWQGVVVPAGTPKMVVDKLYKEVIKALANPDVKERIVGLGMEVMGSTPQQLAAHIDAEVVRWKKVTKEAGIKAD
ncbi:MAG: tripartite tricarboxylate transporter substrate binding protein [Betaproteobacteria bacterium]|nr:tripartite tricarboxylate transporter substrate binding protein [Betaproteobacteria bacterium]